MSPGAHTCHALGCATRIARAQLMCRDHWRMLPPALQAQVKREFRAGQEIRQRRPRPAWFRAARAALDYVAQRECDARRHEQAS